MHRVAFAELILALVMPRERAASTAGDLMEGPRFGWSLVSTFTRSAFGQMTAGLIAKAVLSALLLTAALRFAFMAIVIYGGQLVPHPDWLGPVLGVAYLLGLPVLVGSATARFLPGREITAWTAIAGFVVLSSLAWMLVPNHAVYAFLVTPASLAPMLVGTVLARKKWLRGTPA